jgi:hypothetical protein
MEVGRDCLRNLFCCGFRMLCVEISGSAASEL